MIKFAVQHRKTVGGLLVCYGVLLVVATVGMIAVARLPKEAIAGHCRTSVVQLCERGDAPEIGNLPLLRIDTFTDMIMLNVAYCMGESMPVEAAMRCSFFTDNNMDVFTTTPALVEGATDTADAFFLGYGRYWHGYLLFLRPLLTFATYHDICLLSACIQILLLVICLILIWKRCSAQAAGFLLLALAAVALPISLLCLQFSTCFLLMYLGTIAVLAVPVTTQRAVYIFFTMGALTSFFDLLTTPQLTLGIPLTALLLADRRKADMQHILLLSVCWAAGYSMLWLSKLPVAWLLTGDNLADEFLSNAVGRSSAGLSELLELVAEKLGGNAVMVVGSLIVLGIACLLGFCLWIWQRIRHGAYQPGRRYWLLPIALLTPCWYLLMLQHSIIHYWFTWRALAVSLFCLLLFCFDRTDRPIALNN